MRKFFRVSLKDNSPPTCLQSCDFTFSLFLSLVITRWSVLCMCVVCECVCVCVCVWIVRVNSAKLNEQNALSVF